MSKIPKQKKEQKYTIDSQHTPPVLLLDSSDSSNSKSSSNNKHVGSSGVHEVADVSLTDIGVTIPFSARRTEPCPQCGSSAGELPCCHLDAGRSSPQSSVADWLATQPIPAENGSQPQPSKYRCTPPISIPIQSPDTPAQRDSLAGSPPTSPLGGFSLDLKHQAHLSLDEGIPTDSPRLVGMTTSPPSLSQAPPVSATEAGLVPIPRPSPRRSADQGALGLSRPEGESSQGASTVAPAAGLHHTYTTATCMLLNGRDQEQEHRPKVIRVHAASMRHMTNGSTNGAPGLVSQHGTSAFASLNVAGNNQGVPATTAPPTGGDGRPAGGSAEDVAMETASTQADGGKAMSRRTEHLAKNGNFLLQLYERDQLTDVTVKLPACTFSAHQVVLACHSPVLGRLVSQTVSARHDGKREVVVTDNMTPAAFQIVLDYMYKGDLDISVENLAGVLHAASALQIPPVERHCLAKMAALTPAHALAVLETACTEGIRGIVEMKLLEMISVGFHQVYGSSELQDQCVECLCLVLSLDDLHVTSELQIAMAAVSWLNNQSRPERYSQLSRVLSCVRFKLLTMDELFKMVDMAPYLMEDRDLRARILEANWYQSSLSVRGRPRSPSSLHLRPRVALSEVSSDLSDPEAQTPVAKRSSRTLSTQTDPVQELMQSRKRIVKEAEAKEAQFVIEQASIDGSDLPATPQPTNSTAATPDKKQNPMSTLKRKMQTDSNKDLVRAKLEAASLKVKTYATEEGTKSDSEQQQFSSPQKHKFSKLRELRSATKDESTTTSSDSSGSVKVFQRKMERDGATKQTSSGALSPGFASEVKQLSSSLMMQASDSSRHGTPAANGGASPLFLSPVQSPATRTSDSWLTESSSYASASSDRKGIPIPGASPAGVAVTTGEAAIVAGSQPDRSSQFVIALGGYKLTDSSSDPVQSIHCYSLEQGVWQTLDSTLPSPRAHHSIVYLHDNVYVIGGCDPSDCASEGLYRPSASVYRVSTDEGSWAEVASMATPRMHLHSVVLRGEIYSIGGQDEKFRILDRVERYSPVTDSWECMPSLKHARLGCAATRWQDGIMVVGGLGGKYVCLLDSVEYYDAITNSWSSLTTLRYPRCYPGLKAVCGRLYVVGGLHDVDNQLVPTADVDALTGDRWQKCTEMAYPRYDMACVADGDNLLVIGGVSNDEQALSKMERYDVNTETWLPFQQSMPQPIAGPRCFVANFE